MFKKIPGGAVALGGAFALSALLLLWNSPEPPLKTLAAFFIGPWSSSWFLGNTLDGVALLLTASLGPALAFRGGCFNLGGEGQVYLGGLAAAVALLRSPGSAPAALAAAALAAVVTGGLLGGLAGALKRYCGANELISSFLLSASLSPCADFLLSGPLRDRGGNLLATPRFAAALPRLLPPSALSLSFVFALVLAAAAHLLLNRTGAGYRLRVAGAAPAFARYGGIVPERFWIPCLSLSGALGGLAGFFAVAGTYGRCHLGFSAGLGWNALGVALIARSRPLALIPAAFLYGALKAGSDAALLSTGLSLETAAFIQAAVLLLATARFSIFLPLPLWRGRQIRKIRKK